MGGASQMVDTTERLTMLRELMAKQEPVLNAYVVPSEDQHSSEYLADCDARRAFISGFTGSAGCAVVTEKAAYLFTDGRYFLQAGKQLDPKSWTLMKQGLPDVPTWQEFLYKHLEKNSSIGIDPTLITAVDAKSLREQLEPRGSKLAPLTNNLIDQVWTDRPARPKNLIQPLEVKYSGRSTAEKIEDLRTKLREKKARAMVITMLDEVAWLFNLRGSDIEFNPVFFAYAIVTMDKAILFVNDQQLTPEARSHLADQVEIQPYEQIFNEVGGLGALLHENKDHKILLGNKTSLAIAEAIGKDHIGLARSPVADLKSLKNLTEVEGFRQCHIRDGAALVRYFAWLEERLQTGPEINESQAADQLASFRAENELFVGLSFTTISSTGPNGAIIHYSPNPNDCAIIKQDQMYLCDSGAQYKDGTTDVTRTHHFGTPTTEEIRAFTRVLQGHIAIDTAVWPTGTSGFVLDAFARQALWKDGLDYRHGTGHGVGHFLNVHEGPQGIGTRIAYNEIPLKIGMTLSNEPGYYADGRFGIRIENVCIVKAADTPNNFGDRGYLTFEHVTIAPIQTKLVDTSLLNSQELAWLNNYNAEVLLKLTPLLESFGDMRAKTWLERECAAV